MRKTLSVAVITRNEEGNLERALGSISWADEIVVVDSSSTRAGEELARSFGARFFDEAWKGLADQRNSAIEKCSCDWVLSLDADEMASDGLAKEIWETLHEEPPVDGYLIPRRNLFLGRWIRHGGFYPDRKLKLFRRGSAEFESFTGEAQINFAGKAGRLKGDVVRYAYPSLGEYIEHMDRVSTREARVAVAIGRTGRGFVSFIVNVLIRPLWAFLLNYFLRLGFLDGREGLLIQMYRSASISWKYSKAWELTRE